MHLFINFIDRTIKVLFLLLIIFQSGYSSEFHLTSGTNFFLLNSFSGSGSHEPNNINLKTDNVWADPGFSGIGLKGSLFNIKDSNIGAEFGIQYSKSTFPNQDIELSYYSYDVSVFQPSFQVHSISFQLGMILSPLQKSGLIFQKLKPYAGVGLSYNIATISDVNLEPEYGVGGESDGAGFGYIFKIGTEYIMDKEYIIAVEISYTSNSINVEKFRSYNIDGIDGKFNSLSLMILFGYCF